MDQAFAPLKAQSVEQDGENLEVVVLFVAHHVDHLVDGEVGKALFGCADVLRHIDRGAIGAQQELVVQSLRGEVGPYRTILLAIEESLLQPFEHLLFALQVGVALVVDFIETYAHALVGFVESRIDPVVHALPQSAHLGVAGFPLHEHLAGLFHQG